MTQGASLITPYARKHTHTHAHTDTHRAGSSVAEIGRRADRATRTGIYPKYTQTHSKRPTSVGEMGGRIKLARAGSVGVRRIGIRGIKGVGAVIARRKLPHVVGNLLVQRLQVRRYLVCDLVFRV